MAVKTNSIDMIHSGLWGKILKFALIYMVTAFLQQFYSAADIIVVGRFAGEQALGVIQGIIMRFAAEFLLGFYIDVRGVCGIRIAWIYAVFPIFGTFESLLRCFPLFGARYILYAMYDVCLCIQKGKKRALLEQ